MLAKVLKRFWDESISKPGSKNILMVYLKSNYIFLKVNSSIYLCLIFKLNSTFRSIIKTIKLRS